MRGGDRTWWDCQKPAKPKKPNRKEGEGRDCEKKSHEYKKEFSVLKSEIADFDRKTGVQEGGTVVRSAMALQTVYGMQHAMYGELVEFETGVRGIIQNLEEKTVGVVLLGSDYGIVEGTQVMRTKKSVPVSALALD